LTRRQSAAETSRPENGTTAAIAPPRLDCVRNL
jgi:hypothetical protein